MTAPVFLQGLTLQGQPLQVECQWLNAGQAGPLVVFLHEGLGSLSQWGAFPQQLCDALACRGLVFSRPGYGRSSPRTEAWPRDYLQEQARHQLPAIFEALGIDEPLLLLGHSDGASLALLFAAYFPARVRALVAMAPHLFIEDVTVTGLRAAKVAYEAPRSKLKAALARHHADTDSAFYGWNDAWLKPDYQQWNIEADLQTLACPVLAVQGADDEYATLDQIHAIRRLHPATELLILDRCGHAPQRDQAGLVISRTVEHFDRGR